MSDNFDWGEGKDATNTLDNGASGNGSVDVWGENDKDANAGDENAWNDGDEGNGVVGNDNSCRNCGQAGHFARECPEPRKMMGECFNCGQIGHNKSDCPEPKKIKCFNCDEIGHSKADCPMPHVYRGPCRICSQEGHPGSECPERVCRICNQKGHSANKCEAIRWDVYPRDLPVLSIEAAWDKLVKLSRDDMDEFMPTMLAYAKASLEAGFALNLADVEDGLRNYDSPFYLVALNHDCAPYETIVGVDGRGGKEYVIRLARSPTATRAFEEAIYPSSKEDNIDRLANCGFPMPNKLMICDHCREEGHTRKACPDEAAREPNSNIVRNKCIHCKEEGHRSRDCPTVAPTERLYYGACRVCRRRGHEASNCPQRGSRDRGDLTCNRCGESGHFARDCSSEVRKNITCRKCGEEGHMARDCPSGENEPLECLKCFNCQQVGHMSKDCPNERVIKCKNCDDIGHMSRECPKPRDYSRVQCRNCGEFGHTNVRCTKDKSDSGFDNSASGGLGGEDDASGWGNKIGFKNKSSSFGAKKAAAPFGTDTFGDNNAVGDSWATHTEDEVAW